MNEYALEVKNVTKKYYIGTIGWGTLKKDFQSFVAKRKGLEDPNAPIGYTEEEEYCALKDVSFKIKKGEVVGIIGPNGAGKSTLLKLISSLTSPTSGEIKLNGKVTSILEVGAGFNGELTGRENIYINGSILGMKKEMIDKVVDDIIEFAELEKFIDTPVKRYSSGMYIRLGFAVAVHLLSDIVIIDEALAVGDANFQSVALNKLKAIAKSENRTILYVSHNMATVKELCQKCLVLDKGQVKYFGQVDKAIELYRNKDDNKIISKDITDKDRNDWITPKKTILKKLSFIDKKKNIFYKDEEIGVHLEWENNTKDKSIGVRAIVMNYNQEAVGSSLYYEKNNKDNKLDLYYNFNNLIPGGYHLSIGLFQRDKDGNEKLNDLVSGLSFSIEEEGNLNWDIPKWGCILFDSAKKKS